MVAPVNNSAWVEWMKTMMGGVSRQAAAATFPADRFYCLLDELPLHLIPRKDRQALQNRQDAPPLFLNPNCRVLPADELPVGLMARADLVAAFAGEGMIAWVENPAEKSFSPFWLGTRFQEVVKALSPNEPVPGDVPEDVKSILAAAEILIEEGDTEQDRGRRQKMAGVAVQFQQKGYAPMASLMHPFHVAALRRYYRHLIRTGAIRLGDRQTPRRYAAYNEPAARFFHHQFAKTISVLAGEPLKPSYVYMASYLSGAELKKHTDREQCEYSITFCLDFSPEPEAATSWPICLQTPTGTATVYQALGDGLAYRGTRLPHYRSNLGEGQTSTSIFFHYVAADFTGPLG